MPASKAARQRPLVLVLASYYLPGSKAGGPVRSLSNLIEALGDEFEFHVLTRDRDWNDHAPYESTVSRNPVIVGKAHVRYLRPSISVAWTIRREMRRLAPDLVYFNSFFDPFFSILPLILRRIGLFAPTPILIAPRGQFATGALGVKAPKKRIYTTFARRMGLLRGLRWHATGEAEAADIARHLGNLAGQISLAPNMGMPVSDLEPETRASDCFEVAFVSRISPEKNVLQAIRLARASRMPMQLHIYGPIGNETYWSECREAMAGCPSHVSIEYRGALANERVPEVLRRYDAFLSTTLGENFGHAIVEALSVGVPVIISDRTPWRGLQAAGAGYDIPLEDEAGFLNAFEALSLRTADQVSAMRKCSLAYANKINAAGDAINRSRRMLLDAINA